MGTAEFTAGLEIDIAIFIGQFRLSRKGAMGLTLCEAPTHETRPDHSTGNHVP